MPCDPSAHPGHPTAGPKRTSDHAELFAYFEGWEAVRGISLRVCKTPRVSFHSLSLTGSEFRPSGLN